MTKLVNTAVFVTASCYLTFGLLSPFSSDEVYWTEIDRISIRKAWLFGYRSCTIGLIYIIMESVFITPPLLTLPVLFSASHHEFHVWVETLTLYQVRYYTSVGLVCTFLRRHGVFWSSDNRLGIYTTQACISTPSFRGNVLYPQSVTCFWAWPDSHSSEDGGSIFHRNVSTYQATLCGES